jgi:hypothetical protein
VEPEKTTREKVAAPIRVLWIAYGRSIMKQVLWAVLVLIVLVVLLALISFISTWLWGVVVHYVQPRTPSDRKDLVNVFVVIGAGVVGLLTATAAVGNLYISRRNLQQQRDLEAVRAQDDALQAYYKQMGDLLTEHDLKKTKPDDAVALLARAQSLAVVRRVDGKRKSDLVLFLYGVGLIKQATMIVNLGGADLSGANLPVADLRGVDLRGANLRRADLSDADLSLARLSDARLRRADLSGAMGKAKEQLEQQALTLKGATMPNRQKYEDWLKDREGDKE